MNGKSPVNAMFGRIARVYDLLNHLLSLGIDRSWRRELASLASGQVTLDLAAGTLDVALALHKANPQMRILAVDFCLPMLKLGQKKLNSDALRNAIFIANGDALSLPLADNSVDAITIAFGIRNIQPRKAALAEMLRVLHPGGRLCILEFGSASERIWGGVYNFYLMNLLPLIGRIIAQDKSAYSYLAKTIREFPTASALAREMSEAGFRDAQFRRLTGGIVCLHWGSKP